MSEPSKAAERVIESWEYHGIEFVDGATQHVWEFNGERLVFAKLKAPIAGAVYQVSVGRDESGAFVDVLKKVRFTGQIKDAEKRNAVVAANRINETTASAWRQSKDDNAEAIDNMTIADLRKKMRKYPTLHRRAMLALVLDRLLKGAIV